MKYINPFSEHTGMGVRVAIIDSGVHPAHPHVGSVAGGISLIEGAEGLSYLDTIGHGTAVAGAIREKAPGALLYAVKVFDRGLRTTADVILRALDWSIENEMNIVNLSLGTVNQAHFDRFQSVVTLASASGMIIVASADIAGADSLPGCLPDVIGVGLDWNCPRESMGWKERAGQRILVASGYPRSIPGVSPEKNLHGVSFSVANATGFVARAREAFPSESIWKIRDRLLAE
jgi:subtilisin family serine protease